MKNVKTALYILIQCTWGIIQTLFGLVLFIRFINCKHEFYHGCIKTLANKPCNISLGLFIFVSDEYDPQTSKIMTLHEYGHTFQSLVLGPLYLLVVGLPSIIWCQLPYFQKMRATKNIPYSYLFAEGLADRLGSKFDKSA